MTDPPKETSKDDLDALDELLHALLLSNNDEAGHMYTFLNDSRDRLTRNEMRLLVDLFQRISMRRKWLVGRVL